MNSLYVPVHLTDSFKKKNDQSKKDENTGAKK